jgi:hypothetical protein
VGGLIENQGLVNSFDYGTYRRSAKSHADDMKNIAAMMKKRHSKIDIKYFTILDGIYREINVC